MSLKHLDLTTALRPSLLPDEILLFVQDSVGLYKGKFKIPDFQNGHAYLTSHRICYVDNQQPRKNSVAIDLKEIERHDYYAGFLKSSPKITLVPKPAKRAAIPNRPAVLDSPSRSASVSPLPPAESPFRPAPEPPVASTATWICPICSFSNPVPSNFDPATANIHTPIPPCLACGIKPPLAHVLKAAISTAAKRTAQQTLSPPRSPAPLSVSTGAAARGTPETAVSREAAFECPRCTFLNHPSLVSCEICGASLVSANASNGHGRHELREESPGPVLHTFTHPELEILESLKLSFRGGGADIFHERLKGAMVQRKWLLQGARPVPKANQPDVHGRYSSSDRVKTVGIAGLEQRRLAVRKNNELVIGSAFEDLEALMASAKEVVALAESFASQMQGQNGSSEGNALLAQSASALGFATTKDMLVSGSSSESLYLSELARNLAEFLTDDARGVLRRAGGVMSLVDLWAVFNRARGGVELVSPGDFLKAARLWEQLKLPVRLREFKSGVLVVQASDRTDEKTIKALLAWLRDLHFFPPEREVPWDWRAFGRGVTAQDAADRFGWSIGVAAEELEMAEERGVLCREESIEGLRFWENFILSPDEYAIPMSS